MVYLVAHCVQGKYGLPILGQCFQKDTLEEAVDLAVRLAGEQCDTPEKEIRAEVEKDGDFYDPNGEWSVCIGQFDVENGEEDDPYTITLNDRSTLELDADDGTIRRYDVHGNCEGVWTPCEADYAEYRQLFKVEEVVEDDE